MCGIVGIATTEFQQYIDPIPSLFSQLLFADTFRGKDSTGIFAWHDKMNEPEIFKKALAAPDFLQLKQTQNLLFGNKYDDWQVLVGHNRAATAGRVIHQNAHPFSFGNITMVHNGTISNHRSLPKGNDFDVDSEAIAYALSVEDPKSVISSLRGAFVLVWFDKSDGSFNFVRNDERPFSIAKIKDDDTLVFASEAMMLRWVAGRNSYELKDVWQPKSGVWYKYHPHNTYKNWHASPIVEEIKLAEKITTVSTFGGGYGSSSYSKSYSKHQNIQPTSATCNIAPENLDTLASLGLKPKQVVWLERMSFVPYESSLQGSKTTGSGVYGKIVGKIYEANDDDHIGILHGIKETEWEDVIQGNLLYGKIMNAYVEKGNFYVSLETTSYSVYENDEDEDCVYTVGDEEDKKEEEKPAQQAGFSENTGSLATVPSVRGPDGKLISMQIWEEITKYGCSYCQCNLYPSDDSRMSWSQQGDPICPECTYDQSEDSALKSYH